MGTLFSWLLGECCDLALSIAVLADVHGNLPALRAALGSVRGEKCDYIYHVGDVIGIGPHPSECVGLLMATPKVNLIMGNHEARFVFGIPDPLPPSVTEAYVEHHHWVASQLGSSLRDVIAKWPYLIQKDLGSCRVAFIHYGLGDSGKDFVPVVKEPTITDLDRMFGSLDSDIVFFGHTHHGVDLEGRARYVNPGSVGCHSEPVARFAILEVGEKGFEIVKHQVEYDDSSVFRDLVARDVPDRDNIMRSFFPRSSLHHKM